MSVIFCFDPGHILSYTGGTTLRDVSGNGNDVSVGDSPSATTFYGTYGGLRVGDRLVFGGTGGFEATSNPVSINALHKDNALLTVFGWWKLTSVATQGFFGTNASATANIGAAFRTTAGGALNWFVSSGGAIPLSAAGPAVTTGTWLFLSAVINEAVPSFILGVNDGFSTGISGYSSPSASDSTFPFMIGSSGNDAEPVASGTEMKAMVLLDQALTQNDLLAIYHETRAGMGV